MTCFAFKIVVLRIKNPPFSQKKIWRQNGDKNLVLRFSNAEKTEFLIKKNSSNSEESEELCFRYTIDEHVTAADFCNLFFRLVFTRNLIGRFNQICHDLIELRGVF